jgi:hypothetical protein
MKKKFAIAFAAGAGFGLVFWLILFPSVRVAERLYPPPPDSLIWLAPAVLGAGVAALICGLVCGAGSALILRRLTGETGPVRVRSLTLMSLVWVVVPVLAFVAAGLVLQSPPLGVLVVPVAAALCGLAMVGCTELYVTR